MRRVKNLRPRNVEQQIEQLRSQAIRDAILLSMVR
jgi:hypothetical protein